MNSFHQVCLDNRGEDQQSNKTLGSNQYKILDQDILFKILTQLPIAIIVLDQRGFIQFKSDAFDQLFPQEPCSMKPWREFIAENIHEKAQDGLSGQYLQLKSEKLILLDTYSVENHNKTYQVIVIHDRTNEEQQNTLNLQNYRMKELGRMSAMLAHQLRTPLSTAMIYLNQCIDRDLDKQTVNMKSRKVLSLMDSMNRQISDLLFYVKGDMPIDSQLEIKTIIESTIHLIEHKFNRNNIRFQIKKNILHSKMLCHKDSIVGALSNLIQNSIESSDHHQDILIQVTYEKGFFEFKVIDQGHGLDESFNIKNHSFFSTKKDGNGIGLQFVKVVAKKHGGSFQLSTQNQKTIATLKIKDLFNQKTI